MKRGVGHVSLLIVSQCSVHRGFFNFRKPWGKCSGHVSVVGWGSCHAFPLSLLQSVIHLYLLTSCDLTSVFYFLSFCIWWGMYTTRRECWTIFPWGVAGSQLLSFSRSSFPSPKTRSCWLQGLSLLPVLPLHHTVSTTLLLHQTYPNSHCSIGVV